MAMSEGRAVPAHRTLARRIGVEIVTGLWTPGGQLPTEVELAQSAGCARSVVRESLRMLAAKGLIETRKKAGTRVRERQAWNLLDPELLGWMFEGAPPPAFVRSLFQLRMILEPAAAELAAANRTADHVHRMVEALAAMAHHGLASEIGREADRRFHAVMLEATNNELLVSLSASIEAAVHWTTYFKHRSSNRMRDSIPEHRSLLQAIADADAEASRAAATELIARAEQDTARAIEEVSGKAP